MNVIMLKDSGDFFFDERVEVMRCPSCHGPICIEPYERVSDPSIAWKMALERKFSYLPRSCPRCGYRFLHARMGRFRLPDDCGVRLV